MPIDYQQIYIKIKEIGQGARERSERKAAAQDAARDLLGVYASQLDVLRAKVETAKGADPNIRCALPVNESLVSSHPPPATLTQSTLIAADGSQINPDRHSPRLIDSPETIARFFPATRELRTIETSK